ncbi:uncharacterized protein [Oscarella lobularis]|uniref:uncharacterized protein n=1 Tax=Oscarella lobularis TaxID=121494 RepID=UPI003313B62B
MDGFSSSFSSLDEKVSLGCDTPLSLLSPESEKSQADHADVSTEENKTLIASATQNRLDPFGSSETKTSGVTFEDFATESRTKSLGEFGLTYNVQFKPAAEAIAAEEGDENADFQDGSEASSNSTVVSPTTLFGAWSSRLGALDASGQLSSHRRPQFSLIADSPTEFSPFPDKEAGVTSFLPQSPSSNEQHDIIDEGTCEKGKQLLFCSLPFVHFSGVALGSTSVKKFTIRNTVDKSMKVVLSVGESFKHFLVEADGQKPAASIEVTARAKECFSVVVWFICETERLVQSSLAISLSEIGDTYYLPLSGYGGRSRVQSKRDQIYIQKNGTATLELMNTGSRSAYVKLVWDGSGEAPDVTPDEFVIKPRAKKIVRIDFHSHPASNSGDLYVYSLDEIVRARYVKSCQQFGSANGLPRQLPSNLQSMMDFPLAAKFQSDLHCSQYLQLESDVLLDRLETATLRITSLPSSLPSSSLPTVVVPSPERMNAANRVPEIMNFGSASCQEEKSMVIKLSHIVVSQRFNADTEWKLFSVMPTFSEDADGKLMKASYSVFSVRPRSGVCSKDNEVKATFKPRNRGEFHQVWELEFGSPTTLPVDRPRMYLLLCGSGRRRSSHSLS